METENTPNIIITTERVEMDSGIPEESSVSTIPTEQPVRQVSRTSRYLKKLKTVCTEIENAVFLHFEAHF